MFLKECNKTYSQYDLCDLYDLHSNQLDWLLKGFVLPDLFLKDEQTISILNQYQITNPIDLLKVYCNIKIGRRIRSVKRLYTNVFHNPLFNSELMITSALKVIKAAKNIDSAIDDIVALTYRFKFNADFRALVERAVEYGKTINVYWSEKRVGEELLLLVEPDEVEYVGKLNLPEYARLISTYEQLVRESIEMNHCIKEYWEDVKARACFVFKVEFPYRITVLVRLCEFMDWYIIAEANGEQNNEVYRHDLKEFADVIKTPGSQHFFYINSIVTGKEESLPFIPVLDELPGFPE